jgi:hypothetical protein
MKGLPERYQLTPPRGVVVSRRLAHWSELLQEWCVIHERYCRLVEDDAIYWNIERSNLAALASAAWRSGWAALEEFSHDKILKLAKFYGRADLYMRSPGAHDYVEAKMAWPKGVARPINARQTLRELDSACNDARKIHLANGEGTRIGVVFACPRFPSGAEQPLVELLAPFFEQIEGTELDAVAWCFPPLQNALTALWGGRINLAYPGVVLLARVVA